MTDYDAIITFSIAVCSVFLIILGIRSDTWDSNRRKPTKVGYLVILVGTLALILYNLDSRIDEQQTNEKVQIEKNRHNIIVSEMESSKEELLVELANINNEYDILENLLSNQIANEIERYGLSKISITLQNALVDAHSEEIFIKLIFDEPGDELLLRIAGELVEFEFSENKLRYSVFIDDHGYYMEGRSHRPLDLYRETRPQENISVVHFRSRLKSESEIEDEATQRSLYRLESVSEILAHDYSYDEDTLFYDSDAFQTTSINYLLYTRDLNFIHNNASRPRLDLLQNYHSASAIHIFLDKFTMDCGENEESASFVESYVDRQRPRLTNVEINIGDLPDVIVANSDWELYGIPPDVYGGGACDYRWNYFHEFD